MPMTSTFHYMIDVHVRGEYPGYYLKWLRNNHWDFPLTDEDKAILKAGCPDFFAFNYYRSSCAEACPADVDPALVERYRVDAAAASCRASAAVWTTPAWKQTR